MIYLRKSCVEYMIDAQNKSFLKNIKKLYFLGGKNGYIGL